MIQCQNIVYVLNEHEIVQPKLRMVKRLRDGNDYDVNDKQSDIIEDLSENIEELIHIETEEIVLNKNASQPEKPNQVLQNNENEDVNQTKVQIEPSPHSLRKIKCTHYKNYIYM